MDGEVEMVHRDFENMILAERKSLKEQVASLTAERDAAKDDALVRAGQLKSARDRAKKAEKERDALREALKSVEFAGGRDMCPLCNGWDMGPNGSTPKMHTKNCLIKLALTPKDKKAGTP